VETPTSSRGGDDDDDEVEPPETMADLVYGFLLPRIARVRGQGACVADLRGGGGRF
jgi:hypothetical protein